MKVYFISAWANLKEDGDNSYNVFVDLIKYSYDHVTMLDIKCINGELVQVRYGYYIQSQPVINKNLRQCVAFITSCDVESFVTSSSSMRDLIITEGDIIFNNDITY